MSDAQTILKMIEEVDPADTAKLDEIDARVWVEYTNNGWSADDLHHCYGTIGTGWFCKKASGFVVEVPKYTRSRDALKSIRPEGWVFACDWWPGERWHAELYKLGMEDDTKTDQTLLPTEELAELHAIIQAIDHDRSQK